MPSVNAMRRHNRAAPNKNRIWHQGNMSRPPKESLASRNFKLIIMRCLIAVYLMACSVEIAPGPSLVPTLSRLFPAHTALMLGTVMMFLPAYTMMAGVWLRGSIHILTMLVTLSMILEMFVFKIVPKPGVLMQEILTLCALLQCLMLLKGRDLRHSKLIKKRVIVRRLATDHRKEPVLTPLSVEGPIAAVDMPPVPAPGKKPPRHAEAGDDIVNIFAA